MGFNGRALGKDENGITEPIAAERRSLDSELEGKNKILYVLSSSMLNQMDEKRLCRGNIEVKMQCHGGCTTRCMFSHLPDVFKVKPAYILLHIGSNDCSTKTSDEVLNEFKLLTDYIKKE